MREACVAAIEKALGRALGAGEARGIETRIRLWRKLLGRRDPEAWIKLSGSQQLTAAAKAAATELMGEVAKARQQASLAIAAWDRNEALLAKFDKADWNGRLRALSRLLAFDPGARSGPRSIASSVKALGEAMRGRLVDAIKVANPKIFGLFESREGQHDLIREIYGERTGNALAAQGAKVWREVMGEARDRYNAAGGHIGNLGETYTPQFHDKDLVGNAGFEKWYGRIQPKLDRGKYLEADGTPMKPERVKEFFGHIFDSIISDGANKSIKPGTADMVGPGGIGQRPVGYQLFADRHSQHRQVFFKDAQSFIDYQKEFGRQSFLSMMLNHVNRLARDTAVLESQGPNADAQFKAINDREALQATLANPDAKSRKKIAKLHDFNQRLYEHVAGQRPVADSDVARFFQGFRNVLTGLRLGKVVLTAFGDEAGMMGTAFANKVPYSEMAANQLRLLNPADHSARDAVEAFGFGLNSVIGAINRYADEAYLPGVTGKFSNFVMRVTGAERLWDTRRQAVALTLMHSIGSLTRRVEHFADINEADHGMLARKGITENEWQTWRRAELNVDGAVTPKEIWAIPDAKLKDLGDPRAMKRNASTALGAHLAEEAGMGVMETGERERALTERFMGDPNVNSIGGQVLRSAMLFKTFAASMMLKHWNRAASMGLVGGSKYAAILAVYGTVIAATLNATIRPWLSGQNTPDLTQKRFWLQAILRGGGLGYFGDFMYDTANSRDVNAAEALGGPVATTAGEMLNLTYGAAIKKMKGERTDEGGNLIRFGSDNMPLAHLWYTSALFDHLMTYQAQEFANPGYLDRMMDRQQRLGKTYYWDPHDRLPAQGPKISTAVGE